MAIDLTRVIQAAAESVLEEKGSGSKDRKEGSEQGVKRGLSVPSAFLIGAGLMAAGRLVAGSRGREMLEGLQERLIDYEERHFGSDDAEAPEDEDFEDEEPEAEEDEDFDEEDEEPEAEEDEDFDDEDEEPEAEEDEDFDDEDEEPEAEEDEDFEEEDEPAPPRRRRARSGSSSNGRH